MMKTIMLKKKIIFVVVKEVITPTQKCKRQIKDFLSTFLGIMNELGKFFVVFKGLSLEAKLLDSNKVIL